MLNALGIRVQREDLVSFAQQMYQVSPVATSSVEHAHTRCDVPSQDLVEYVNVDLPKLFLNAWRHRATLLAFRSDLREINQLGCTGLASVLAATGQVDEKSTCPAE